MTDAIELTILMPCLNEAETLGACIEKARLGIELSGVRAEILVADNGSQDGSVQIAEETRSARHSCREKGTGTPCALALKPHQGNGLSWATPTRVMIFQRQTVL